ncbi:MAG: dihydroneopterin aldolase [Prevotellaceae bacterium]|jgi:dihydroneopterin aldolase|nr:dihydroneopterin aldolase [Prevotellaceae bacterium]
MKYTISLKGMEFYAYHGCFREEKIIGTRFKVDASLVCHVEEAAISDDIHKTVNYQQVYEEIKKIIDQPANILESIAYRILTQLKIVFPQIAQATITVYKLNPSIGGKTESVSVSIEDNYGTPKMGS